MTAFAWTQARERAALLLAEDDFSDAQIAEMAGVSRTTLDRWKNVADFDARVKDHVAALQRSMRRHAIAKRHKRLKVLNDLHDKMLAMIQERATGMSDEAPGTGTGLIVKQVKQIGGGETARIVEEYVFDRALVAEIRSVQEQAARELGQWEERQLVSGEIGIRQYVGVDPDAV